MQKRQSFLYIFLAFLILSLILFFLFKLPIFKPLTSFTQNIFSPIQSLVYNISNSTLGIFSNSKIRQLEAENLNLSKKILDQKKIEADNKALRDQFAVSYPKSTNLVTATVIGSPTFIPGISLPENFILNKGERDGIKIGQAVVYKDNLIGKVVQVSDNVSKISLITNADFSITAQTVESQSVGIAKGQGGGDIIFDNVLLSQSIKKDDFVITKGDIDIKGNGLPPSLIIGKIVSINKNPSDLFQIAKVKSMLDFTKLKIVYIVKNL